MGIIVIERPQLNRVLAAAQSETFATVERAKRAYINGLKLLGGVVAAQSEAFATMERTKRAYIDGLKPLIVLAAAQSEAFATVERTSRVSADAQKSSRELAVRQKSFLLPADVYNLNRSLDYIGQDKRLFDFGCEEKNREFKRYSCVEKIMTSNKITDKVKNSLHEAINCLNSGDYYGAAVRLRRTFEFSLETLVPKKFLKPTGIRSSYDCVEYLVREGKLTPELKEMTDIIRRLGNDKVHEEEEAANPILISRLLCYLEFFLMCKFVDSSQ